MAKKKRTGKLRAKVLKEYAGPGSAYHAKDLGRNAREQIITEKEEEVIFKCLRHGGSRSDAMKLIGRTGSTNDLILLVRKAERHPDFKALLDQAEAEGKLHHLENIYEGGARWSAWMLERKWWREFAARTPDSFTREQVLMLVLSLAQVVNDVVKSGALRHEIDTRLSDLLAGMGMKAAARSAAPADVAT